MKLWSFKAQILLSLLLELLVRESIQQCSSNIHCFNVYQQLCISGTCSGCNSDSDCATYMPSKPFCGKWKICVAACSSDTDCTSTWHPKCNSGRCDICTGSSNCAHFGSGWTCNSWGGCGQPCSNNNNCNDILMSWCSSGYCDYCRNSGQCSQFTGMSKCNDACVACLASTDCPSSAPLCQNNQCIKPCTVNTDCPLADTSRCLGGYCAECASNGDCSHISGKNYCSGGTCVACTANTECTVATASKCSSNTCSGCSIDSDCSHITGKNHCSSGTCVACSANSHCTLATASKCSSNTCTGCSIDSDCSHISGKNRCSSGTCVACTDISQCTSATASRCVSNTCTSCSIDSECSHITGKNYCSSGTCVACTGNTQCTLATASRCSSNTCTICSMDSDCSHITGKNYCSGGRCVACSANSQCTSLTASKCGVSNTCSSCSIDSDCSHITGNNYCSGGTCVACKADSHCPASPVSECLSNTCVACSVVGKVAIAGSCQSCPANKYPEYTTQSCLDCSEFCKRFPGSLPSACPSCFGAMTQQVFESSQSATKYSLLVTSFFLGRQAQNIFSGILSKMVQYIKYLDVAYSSDLVFVLKNTNSNLFAIPFPINTPEPFQDDQSVYKTLPPTFVEYDVHPSFLSNFWDDLQFMGAILGLLIFSAILEKYVFTLKNSFTKKVRISLQNNLLMLLYEGYGDMFFSSINEFRTIQWGQKKLIWSFSMACFFLIIGFLLLSFHLKILLNYRTMLASENKNNPSRKEKEKFLQKNEGFKVLFEDFKDRDMSQQAFLLISTFRFVLFNIILATLFEYPQTQVVLSLTLNIFMVFYLIIKRPFINVVNLVQIILNEFIVLLVNCCVLTMTHIDKDDSSTRFIASDIIIYVILSLNFIPLGFLAIDLLVMIRNYCKKRKKYLKPPKPEMIRPRRNLRQESGLPQSIEQKIHPPFNESSLSGLLDIDPGRQIKQPRSIRASARTSDSLHLSFDIDERQRNQNQDRVRLTKPKLGRVAKRKNKMK